MLFARLVVALAALATLAFNAGYAWNRGHSEFEKASLVLLAVIIDFAKISFLAAGAILWRRRQRVASGILVLLWCPAIVLSCWASYSFVATSRAGITAGTNSAQATRIRAEQAFARATRTVALATNDPAFTATAGCTRATTTKSKAFCDGYRQAEADLKVADRALAPLAAVTVDPEVVQLARLTGADRALLDLWIAVIPALFLELVASLGFYAVSAARLQEAIPTATETPKKAVLSTEAAVTPAAPPNPPEPRSVAPVAPGPRTLKAARPFTPATDRARSALP